ncbi:MAG: hypothetical protein IPF98_04755 [Gemmatimonadetes bacterium]|nr:hypothetical protein [Gemmatimonadota bacterium]
MPAVPEGTLSVVLMIGAGLFVWSFARAASADLGFVAEQLIVRYCRSSESVNSPEEFEAHWLRMEERIRRLPRGVAVAQSVTVPFESQWTYSVLLNGDTLPLIKGGGLHLNGISTDYFRALQTPVIRGR